MTDLQRGGPDASTRTKTPTIYDVAKAASVSPSTVSRALARPGRVSAATAAHVRRVAAELGYHVNLIAPGLRTGRTSMLALVVSDVTNPVYTEVIGGAQAAASEAGYVLVLIDAQESDLLEHGGLVRALPAVEGVVLAGTRLSDAAIGEVAGKRPVVVLNREVAGVPGILLDSAYGTRAIVEHLWALGHRSLTYIGGPEASWADGVRLRGLRDAAGDLGAVVLGSGPYEPTVAGGRAAAAALPDVLPTAIVAYNDQLAIGLMLALQSRGIRVPEDVSIVGHDNIAPAQIVNPALTTIVAPLHAQGQAAVNAVLAALKNPGAASAKPVTLPVRLVVRGSTGRPRARSAG
ncbi:MAG TPA: LacI family DNA-binding transcriptional regulator [Yinghuangia sp.]|nr:LacI family DNA-binding transcriptional regulator [Yinghuangia sp.]